jgi:hypothetical protein
VQGVQRQQQQHIRPRDAGRRRTWCCRGLAVARCTRTIEYDAWAYIDERVVDEDEDEDEDADCGWMVGHTRKKA